MIRTHHEHIRTGETTSLPTILAALVRSTAARDKTRPAAPDPTAAAVTHTPENKLTDAERRTALDVLDSDRFVDRAPAEVYAQLLDEGIYLCSVSTMYRILRENAQVTDRRRQARHPARACPELVATAPREVYSWDTTKLPGPVKGTYFDAYVMIDIFSRYIVGALVQTRESGLLAAGMMTETFLCTEYRTSCTPTGASRRPARPSPPCSPISTSPASIPGASIQRQPYSQSLFKSLEYGAAFPERQTPADDRPESLAASLTDPRFSTPGCRYRHGTQTPRACPRSLVGARVSRSRARFDDGGPDCPDRCERCDADPHRRPSGVHRSRVSRGRLGGSPQGSRLAERTRTGSPSSACHRRRRTRTHIPRGKPSPGGCCPSTVLRLPPGGRGQSRALIANRRFASLRLHKGRRPRQPRRTTCRPRCGRHVISEQPTCAVRSVRFPQSVAGRGGPARQCVVDYLNAHCAGDQAFHRGSSHRPVEPPMARVTAAVFRRLF
ncbi:hypothetical protein R1CP_32825 [Rhodococcus opacus]|uniref:Uncharacterized protein n=1 Tax=Rhodococcus opacus TaxID=37919 RepID=A0A1B1KF21_RHOOP|nr:hypothetical protein R1CP_32825 [Rhodococcus opacus]